MFKFLSKAQQTALKELADKEIEAKRKAADEKYNNQRFEYMLKPLEKFKEELDYSAPYSIIRYDHTAIYIYRSEYEIISKAIEIMKSHKSELLR